MKKSSTAKAASNKNFEQKLTIGLDLGDRMSWYCVLDEAGEVMSEQKLGTTPKAMKEVFAAMPRSRIALETGMHSPWVSRLPCKSLSRENAALLTRASEERAKPNMQNTPQLATVPLGSGFLLYAEPDIHVSLCQEKTQLS